MIPKVVSWGSRKRRSGFWCLGYAKFHWFPGPPTFRTILNRSLCGTEAITDEHSIRLKHGDDEKCARCKLLLSKNAQAKLK